MLVATRFTHRGNCITVRTIGKYPGAPRHGDTTVRKGHAVIMRAKYDQARLVCVIARDHGVVTHYVSDGSRPQISASASRVTLRFAATRGQRAAGVDSLEISWRLPGQCSARWGHQSAVVDGVDGPSDHSESAVLEWYAKNICHFRKVIPDFDERAALGAKPRVHLVGADLLFMDECLPSIFCVASAFRVSSRSTR